ncbi:MAG: DMT family transporter [Chloroflexi bacterium]|nr:DMT family transporter [Chloroflexota bacterium]
MKTTLLLGTLLAMGTGILIGSQATIGGRLGALIGPARVGIWMNVAGGLIALVLAGVLVARTPEAWPLPGRVVAWLLFAGLLGILIVTGSSLALGRVGAAAGLSAMIFGQMLVATIYDATGLSTGAPIPVQGARIFGLAVMAVAVYLLLPRQ